MIRLRILFFLLFVALGIQNANSQTYKFMTTGFSVLERNPKGDWDKWSDLEKVSLLITLDTDKNRIVVYSREIQVYEIVEYIEKKENENEEIYTFNCSDLDGRPFTISIITRKNQDNRKQLYINEKNVILVYNIINYVDKNQK